MFERKIQDKIPLIDQPKEIDSELAQRDEIEAMKESTSGFRYRRNIAHFEKIPLDSSYQLREISR